MKIKTALFILALFAVTQSAFAGSAGEKFVRGIEGTLTSPVEYLNQYQIANYDHGLISSAVIMVLGGTAMTVKRLINGVYDIVSFPVSLPRDYGLLLNDKYETALDGYRATQGEGLAILGK
ncbi:MAG TPA: exosortase system-associated protein, TIGR04073 family [Candidatus Omnitrophota bacterium]|nr:exosortase system-associated protein, TIGR04073 family [Candidatus Omnitrophota bacterium]